MSGLLIVNADDLGHDEQATDATIACARDRRITSATAMVYMADSERAAELAGNAPLGVGLHLNLSESFSGDGVPATVRARHERLVARFHDDRPRQLMRWLYDPRIRADVEATIADQWERFETLYGRQPTHVDGHQHVHLSPNVLFARAIPPHTKMRRTVARPGAAARRGGTLRRIRDRLVARRFVSTDYVFDISEVDPRTDPAHAEAKLGLAGSGAVEVMAHPGFDHELERLMAPEWTQALTGFRLGSFADL